jgi:hypothetical protein
LIANLQVHANLGDGTGKENQRTGQKRKLPAVKSRAQLKTEKMPESRAESSEPVRIRLISAIARLREARAPEV